MKLHVMSDLHFEFLSNFDESQFWRILDSKVATSPGATLVLAGDIYNLKNPKRFEHILSEFCSRYGSVIYTPGNHEHWKYSIREASLYLADLEKDPKFHNLMYVRPGGKLPYVLGGTLWYPDCKNEAFKAQWCDYYMISDSATSIEAEHQRFVADLMSREVSLVVSHHYPTDESIGPRWVGQPTNVFFSANMDGILKNRAEFFKPPKLWVHGHTHDPMDYISKHGFRVYCNPHGYPGENSNPQFWNRLEVEVAI